VNITILRILFIDSSQQVLGVLAGPGAQRGVGGDGPEPVADENQALCVLVID
jgi:hypothetical protein